MRRGDGAPYQRVSGGVSAVAKKRTSTEGARVGEVEEQRRATKPSKGKGKEKIPKQVRRSFLLLIVFALR